MSHHIFPAGAGAGVGAGAGAGVGSGVGVEVRVILSLEFEVFRGKNQVPSPDSHPGRLARSISRR